MDFGKNIAAARKRKGMSQKELADKVGIIYVTIGRYERGEIKPSIDVAKKIADALDVSLDYLVGSTATLMDKALVQTVLDIQNLPEEKKKVVMTLLDAFLKQTKLEKIMG